MISEQDVAFYRENGYVVVTDVLSEAEVADLRRVTEEIERQLAEKRRLARCRS